MRGLNDEHKRMVVYNEIDENNCDAICLQETKCEDF
jgi:exonuclease III